MYSPEPNFYPEDKKINLNVGLVKDVTVRNLKFRASNTGHAVDIDIGNSMIETLKSELLNIFKEVNVVDEVTTGSKFDLYVFSNIEWIEVRRDSRGNMDYVVKMKVKFKFV